MCWYMAAFVFARKRAQSLRSLLQRVGFGRRAVVQVAAPVYK